VLAAVALAACVLAPVLVALGGPTPLTFAAVLTVMCVAPGAALSAAGAPKDLGLVIGVSLGTSTVLAQVMLWLGLWWPKPFLYVLCAACGGRLAVMARRGGERRLVRRPRLVRAPAEHVVLHAAILAAALAAWAAALAGTDLADVDGYGLISALPPTYVLALALLISGFADVVSRAVPDRRLLAIYVLALIVVIHATTPILYDTPRYPWVFKHLGVIERIAATGSVDREIDIYNNWPAFFALNAWLTDTTRVAAAQYAEWAQVFFNVVNVLALRFMLRGVTFDDRVIWTASWLFLLANFIGQDYLAPQAFAFFLSMVAVGICLRPMRHRPPALTAFAVVAVAVVLSHQLTPLMLLAALTALAVVTRRVPLWIPAALAVTEVWWLWLAWPFLTRHFQLFDPNPGGSASPPVAHALDGVALVTKAPLVVVAIVAALAGAGALLRRRHGCFDLPIAALIAGPTLVAGVQSYGGEGRIRLFLFILPWLCLLAAAACGSAWRLRLAGAALATGLLFAYFGLEYVNQGSRSDIAAARWFEHRAPRRSSLLSFAPYFPYRLTARYAEVYSNSTTLPEQDFGRRRLGERDIPIVLRDVREFDQPRFIILSPGQERYSRLYGLLGLSSTAPLARALDRSPRFRLVYSRDGTSIYQEVAARRGAARARRRR